MDICDKVVLGDYICILALEDGVDIIGMTREGILNFTTQKNWTRVR